MFIKRVVKSRIFQELSKMMIFNVQMAMNFVYEILPALI